MKPAGRHVLCMERMLLWNENGFRDFNQEILPVQDASHSGQPTEISHDKMMGLVDSNSPLYNQDDQIFFKYPSRMLKTICINFVTLAGFMLGCDIN